MDEDITGWIGLFAFPIAIIALLFAVTSTGTTYSFNSTQFITDMTNISINENWMVDFINVTVIDDLYCKLAGCSMRGNLNMNGNNITNLNYLKFNISNCNNVDMTETGALCWNSQKSTLNMVTGLGNIIQIGQENFEIIKNNAGKKIYAGQIVAVSNSSGEMPQGTLANANTSNANLHNLAMVTIPFCNANAACVVTTWGEVHDLDTSLYPEGTEVFLSADGSGNYTSTKLGYPNAYNMHIGTVLRQHATTGIILFHREMDYDDGVTINQLGVMTNLTVGGNTTVNNLVITGNLSAKRPYGMFSSTEDQTIALANTAYPVTFNWTDDAYLIYKTGNSNFTVAQNGDYLIELSAVFQTGVSNQKSHLWVQIWNGTKWNNVPRSNTEMAIRTINSDYIISVPFILDIHTNEKFRIMFAGSDASVFLNYMTNTSFAPETPSIIMTVSKISETTS